MKEIKKESWHFKLLEKHRLDNYFNSAKWYWGDIKTCGQYRWLLAKYITLEFLLHLMWTSSLGFLLALIYSKLGFVWGSCLISAMIGIASFFIFFQNIKKKIISMCSEPIRIVEDKKS